MGKGEGKVGGRKGKEEREGVGEGGKWRREKRRSIYFTCTSCNSHACRQLGLQKRN